MRAEKGGSTPGAPLYDVSQPGYLKSNRSQYGKAVAALMVDHFRNATKMVCAVCWMEVASGERVG